MKKNQIRLLCLFLCICLSCAGLVPGIGGSRAGAEAVGRWFQTRDGWMYLEGSTAATGWKQIGSSWYWFDASGMMAEGWREISGVWYYFDASGVMQTGWLQLEGIWYYFTPDGAMVTGRQEIDGKWYEFSADGAWIEGGKTLSLFDVPWGATYAEVKSALPEGLELGSSGNSWDWWFTADGFLSTGDLFSSEDLGFMATGYTGYGDERFVYYGQPVENIHFYFLYTFDGNGNLVCDMNHSALICAELEFVSTDNYTQAHEEILRQLTEKYGAPAGHQEKKGLLDRVIVTDFWNGADGSRMCLKLGDFGELSIRYTCAEMDRMLNDVNNALSGVLYSAPGSGFTDGTPLRFEKFTLSTSPGLYYEVLEKADNQFIIPLVYLLPDYSDGVWYGDDMMAFDWALFSSVRNVYEYISMDIDRAYTRTPKYDIFPETGKDSVFKGRTCTVYDAECTFTIPEEQSGEVYAYYIRVFVFPSPLSCAFAVCSFTYGDLDVLAGQLESMLTWK